MNFLSKNINASNKVIPLVCTVCFTWYNGNKKYSP